MKEHMKLEDVIRLPVRTDRSGTYIYDAKGVVLFNVRGYGFFKAVAGEENAPRLQREMVDFMIERINANTNLCAFKTRLKAFMRDRGVEPKVVDEIMNEFLGREK